MSNAELRPIDARNKYCPFNSMNPCHAQDCMAWRWVDTPNEMMRLPSFESHRLEDLHKDGWKQVEGRINTIFLERPRKDRKGGCGLVHSCNTDGQHG